MADAKNALNDIHVMQDKKMKRSVWITDDVVVHVEKALFSMGLIDDQEIQIMHILTDTVNRSLDNF